MDDQGVRVAAPGAGASAAQLQAWDHLLEIDFAQPHAQAASRPSGFVLYLNGGDRLLGTPISIADDTVAWKESSVGSVSVSEDSVNAIVRAGQTVDDLTQPRKADVVRLINGDATSGVIESMGDSTVTIHPTDATVSAQISLDKVAAILLADPDPTAAAPGRAWRVWLSDGSYLTVPIARIAADQPGNLVMGFSEQHVFSIDLAAVAGVEQTRGPVRWLTDLTPSAVVYHPFFDESFPPQFDHPVDDPGVTIRTAYPPYRHGIGVHSYTRLTYAVPDGFAAFRTEFQVERIAGSDMTKADLNVRILADGQVAKEFDHVRYGATHDAVVVDVAGKKELSLEVDFGDNSPAQGRFLWLDPAFLKSAPATQPAN